jgi:hypothetical protein
LRLQLPRQEEICLDVRREVEVSLDAGRAGTFPIFPGF